MEKQLELDLYDHRGGKRRGAGRKPTLPEPQRRHTTRDEITRSTPLHITLRLRAGLPSLRKREAFCILCDAFAEARERFGVRIIHYGTLGNHIHLIVEAPDRDAVARAMNGLQVRLTKRLNRLWERSGAIFSDRYHDEVLRVPLQARNALRYVLHNARKHGIELLTAFDPCSSAAAFDGWRHPTLGRQKLRTVVPPKCWLLTVGWRKHGLIGLHELPPGD
jgi:REP element-mobilizing transposase RayT